MDIINLAEQQLLKDGIPVMEDVYNGFEDLQEFLENEKLEMSYEKVMETIGERIQTNLAYIASSSNKNWTEKQPTLEPVDLLLSQTDIENLRTVIPITAKQVLDNKAYYKNGNTLIPYNMSYSEEEKQKLVEAVTSVFFEGIGVYEKPTTSELLERREIDNNLVHKIANEFVERAAQFYPKRQSIINKIEQAEKKASVRNNMESPACVGKKAVEL